MFCNLQSYIRRGYIRFQISLIFQITILSVANERKSAPDLAKSSNARQHPPQLPLILPNACAHY